MHLLLLGFLTLAQGSSDMWIAHTTCATCSTVPQFDETLSSSFVATRTPFSIQYGSGAAAGLMGSDVVQMGGFEVPNQPFGKPCLWRCSQRITRAYTREQQPSPTKLPTAFWTMTSPASLVLDLAPSHLHARHHLSKHSLNKVLCNNRCSVSS